MLGSQASTDPLSPLSVPTRAVSTPAPRSQALQMGTAPPGSPGGSPEVSPSGPDRLRVCRVLFPHFLMAFLPLPSPPGAFSIFCFYSTAVLSS